MEEWLNEVMKILKEWNIYSNQSYVRRMKQYVEIFSHSC